MKMPSVVRKAGVRIALFLSVAIAVLVMQHAPKTEAAVNFQVNWVNATVLNLTGSGLVTQPLQITGNFVNNGGSQQFEGSVLANMNFGCKILTTVIIDADGSGTFDYSVGELDFRTKLGGSTCTQQQLKDNIPGLVQPLVGSVGDLALENFPLGSVDKRAGPGGGNPNATINVTVVMGPFGQGETLVKGTDTFILCASTGPYVNNQSSLDQDCIAQKAGTVSKTLTSGQAQIANNTATWKGSFTGVTSGVYDVCSATLKACKLVTVLDQADVTISGSSPGSGGGGAATKSTDACDNADFTELNFWVCGFIKLLSDTAAKLDNEVLQLLKIDTDTIFNDSGNNKAGNAYFVAWSAFRDIAYAILVILALIMVASQVLGLDAFDAYTVRKMLPRFIIAVIFIALSWNLLDFVFNMSNDAADAGRAIVSAPFSKIDVTIGNTASNDISLGVIIPTLLTVGVGAGVAALALLGVGGIAALVGSILLAVASAWVLLVARNVVATMLVVMSPVAIVCWVLGR